MHQASSHHLLQPEVHVVCNNSLLEGNSSSKAVRIQMINTKKAVKLQITKYLAGLARH